MVRKMILTAAVAMLIVPAMASAQSTVTATATVGETAVVSGAGDLAFGTLSATVDNVIDAAGGATVRTIDYNHDIDVTFTSVPAALSSTGLADLPIALTCASQLGGVWSTPVACAGSTLALDVGTALTQATLGFGGTILAADVANAAAGDYTATFNIVVTAR